MGHKFKKHEGKSVRELREPGKIAPIHFFDEAYDFELQRNQLTSHPHLYFTTESKNLKKIIYQDTSHAEYERVMRGFTEESLVQLHRLASGEIKSNELGSLYYVGNAADTKKAAEFLKVLKNSAVKQTVVTENTASTEQDEFYYGRFEKFKKRLDKGDSWWDAQGSMLSERKLKKWAEGKISGFSPHSKRNAIVLNNVGHLMGERVKRKIARKAKEEPKQKQDPLMRWWPWIKPEYKRVFGEDPPFSPPNYDPPIKRIITDPRIDDPERKRRITAFFIKQKEELDRQREAKKIKLTRFDDVVTTTAAPRVKSTKELVKSKKTTPYLKNISVSGFFSYIREWRGKILSTYGMMRGRQMRGDEGETSYDSTVNSYLGGIYTKVKKMKDSSIRTAIERMDDMDNKNAMRTSEEYYALWALHNAVGNTQRAKKAERAYFAARDIELDTQLNEIERLRTAKKLSREDRGIKEALWVSFRASMLSDPKSKLARK